MTMAPRPQQSGADDTLQEPLLSSSGDSAVHTGDTNNNDGQNRLLSRNVPLTLIYTAFVYAGRSIWNQSVLATFVFLLRDNDAASVGYITGVMGIAQLLTSFPTGVLADSHRRDYAAKIASVVGAAAIGLTLYASYYEHYIPLLFALAIWGCFWGIADTSVMALFADSIPSGHRSLHFTRRTMLAAMGNTTGPLVALGMFAWLGNDWTVRDCATVVACGQLLSFPAMLFLCFFNDDHAAPESTNGESNIGDEEGACLDQDHAVEGDNEAEDAEHGVLCGLIPAQRVVPAWIAISDLIAGIGSGMSIRYFPIFFVDSLLLSPVMVQILYVATPLMSTILLNFNQKLAQRFGRCHVTVASKWIGIGLMLLMVTSYWCHLPNWFVCVVYVLRTTFMNSTKPLTRSMVMDHVPKEERGKWSAIESVNMFSWSGSAAMGGLVVQSIGVEPLFCVTAFIQFVSSLFVLSLFPQDEVEHELG